MTNIKLAPMLKEQRRAVIEAVAMHGPDTVGNFLAELIAYRIEKSGDISNILTSIMQGIRAAETSDVERRYFDICDSAIAGAWAEIHKKQSDALEAQKSTQKAAVVVRSGWDADRVVTGRDGRTYHPDAAPAWQFEG